MANILLDYAVPFKQVESLPEPEYGFLHTMAIAVMHDDPLLPADITLCTTIPQMAELTSHFGELTAVFDGGLSKVWLIRVNQGQELADILRDKESIFYTVYCHQSIGTTAFLEGTTAWKGVSGTVSVNVMDAQYAKRDRTCLFGCSGLLSSYNAVFAFSSLLSSASWRNQQYVNSASSDGAVITLGEAETAFDARISFWLKDDDNGTRLGFFGAGGKSVTTPYIAKEIEVDMQYQMTNFLTVNQPFNIAVERAELERIGNLIISDNIERGYLDADAVNTIKVTDSVEAFVVAGNLTISPSVALWRIKMDAYQTQG